MERRILKTIPIMKKLNVEELNKLNLGVEIQDFVEPNLSDVWFNYLVKNYKEILKSFKNLKSIHGPFLDLKPASPDKDIRQVSYNKYLRTLRAAKDLEVDYIIFHSQINPYLNEPGLRRLNAYQAKEFWEKILKDLGDFKGTILIENIFEDSPSMLKEMMEIINKPNIRVNLDIGHANLGKVSLEDWIRELKEYISYIHIHTNGGQYDSHSVPDESLIKELYELLDKYEINPVLSLEYKIENLEEEIKKYKEKALE